MSYTPPTHQLISHEDALALETERLFVRMQVKEMLEDIISKIDLEAALRGFVGSLPVVQVPYIQLTVNLGPVQDVNDEQAPPQT